MNNESAKNGHSMPTVTTAHQALVQAGREKFAHEFPEEHQSFDAMSWDVKNLSNRPAAEKQAVLYFTRYGTLNQPLPQIYAEIVKSWLILERQSTSNMFQRNAMARLLWEAICLRRRNEEAPFAWQNLCEEDLSQAELLMQKYWASSTSSKQGNRLLGMIHFLAARSICRPLYYVLQTPCTEDFSRHTIAGQEASMTKLPSKRALEGIADIYHIHAKSPADRLRASALALLVVTGFRLGELLTLPLECDVTELSEGKERYGLRYYKEKARGSERMLDIRWLTPTGAELARNAIAEIREITLPARERSKILEHNPNRVPIPGYQWADVMRPDNVAKVLGVKHPRSVYRIPSDQLPRHGTKGKYFYRANEVEAYLLSERVKHLWTLDRRDGSHQMLSETLLIAFVKHFRSGCHENRLLVEPMTSDHLELFLTGKGGAKSAFERFGISEEEGNVCKMTSHQFRHWLNDIADKGGLPVDLQTRWLGRENPQDTQAYQHATVEERLQWLKNGIRDGEICGTIANVYFALPEEDRDVFLEGQIQAVHFTPLGLCIHDFAIDPCPYYLNCARKCPEYLRTKGNQQERHNLIQVQRRTKQALELAQDQAAAGNGETAQGWIQHYEETLAGVEAALAVDDDSTIGDGLMVQPFPNHPSRFQPL